MDKNKKRVYGSPSKGKSRGQYCPNSELTFKRLLTNAGFSEKTATDIWKWYENDRA